VDTPLSEFLDKAAPQIEGLRESWKLAHTAFLQCAEYYSEPVKTAQPDSFFSRLASFLKNFGQAMADNESKAAAERRQKAEQERRAQRSRVGANAAGDKMINELNSTFLRSMKGSNNRTGTRKIDVSNLEHGDFEKIMHGLNDGFMASDSPVAPPVPLVRRRPKGTNHTDSKHSPSPNRRSKVDTQLHEQSGRGVGAREVQRERT